MFRETLGRVYRRLTDLCMPLCSLARDWTDYKRAATRPKAKRTFLQVLSHRVKVKIGTGSRQNARKQAKWQ